MEKVLLGMSGGVDSSVAAILLQQQGYEVIGVTMHLSKLEDITSAQEVCKKLHIKHYVIDARKEFEQNVISDFIEKYEKCYTPNPCIKCNRYLKFGLMYEKAKEFGCKYIATGHYAKVEYDELYQSYVLKKSDSIKKDQSYVLYSIPKEVLPYILFPLGEFQEKEEIREIARKYGLKVADKKDSEDICFIPDHDYVRFLEQHMKQKKKPGNIVNKEHHILGRHEGLHRYTIGQRRGMGIASVHPLYVIYLDEKKNELVVGEEKDIFSDQVKVENVNLLLGEKIKDGTVVTAKVRYAAEGKKATIFVNQDQTLTVKFEEKVRAITPGQSIVFYIGDVVLGGGEIAKEMLK